MTDDQQMPTIPSEPRDVRGAAKRVGFAAYWGLRCIPNTQLGMVAGAGYIVGLAWLFDSPLILTTAAAFTLAGVFAINFRTRLVHDRAAARQMAEWQERKEVAKVAFENALRAVKVADGDPSALMRVSLEAQIFHGVSPQELQDIAAKVEAEGRGDEGSV